MSESKETAPPVTSSLLNEGYNQTYIIFPPSESGEDKSTSSKHERDTFFRCGNWCYRGPINFEGVSVGTSDLPAMIPMLQRQQGNLRYYCNASRYVTLQQRTHLCRYIFSFIYPLCLHP